MAEDNEQNEPKGVRGVTKISTEKFALFLVDALIDAKIVHQKDLNKAMEIVVEEINVRKAIGDY